MKPATLTLDMYTSQNKMKKLLLTLMILVGLQVAAQQNPTMDNYLFNPVSISPAYAGHQDGQVQSIYDAQWIGLKGAPRTGALYYDHLTPNRFGFNLGIIDDQVGPMTTQSIGVTTAYHLQIADDVYFATGVRYTLTHTEVDITDEFYVDKIDQAIYDIDGPWIQNVDLSGAVYNSQWYFGATMKNMVKQEMYNNNFTSRVAHIFGGYKHELNDEWTLSSSFLLNLSANAPLDPNFHFFFEYKDNLGGGINFSPRDEAGMFFKLNVFEGWQLFYQYNYPLSDLVYITKQSHVLGIGIDIKSSQQTLVSPGYFL